METRKLGLCIALVGFVLGLFLISADESHAFMDFLVQTPAAQARTAAGDCPGANTVCYEICDEYNGNGPTGEFVCDVYPLENPSTGIGGP